jgi:sodium/proline symporter
MDPKVAIVVTLVVYNIALLALGFVASRMTRDATDLYLGGRRMGPLVAAISASASSSSVWTLLGVSGLAFKSGLAALWLFPACVGGFALNWCLIAPRLRRHSAASGALTLTDVLAGPGGERAPAGRRAVVGVASLITLLCLLVYVAAQLNGASKSFESTLEMDPTTAVLIGSGIIVIYMMLGGFWAVSLTDTLQGLLMAATAVLLPVAALIEVGGPAALVERLAVAPPSASYLSLTRDLPLIAGIGMVLGLLGIAPGYPGQPHVVNRFMALRDEAALRRARVYALTWAVIVYTGMIVLGLCGRLLLQDTPPDYDSEQVFFDLSLRLFHPLVTGVLLAAVLSAIMSTADSQLLVAASTVNHDLGFARGSTSITRDRLVIFGLSALAVGAALFGEQRIFDQVLSAWSAMGAAFAPLLAWILFRGAVAPRVAIATMVAGFGSSVLGHLGSTAVFGWWNLQGSERNFLPYVVAVVVLMVGLSATGSATGPATGPAKATDSA